MRQVTHLLGKPLLRVFPELRGIHQLESGWGLNIVPPPDHDSSEVRGLRVASPECHPGPVWMCRRVPKAVQPAGEDCPYDGTPALPV